MKESQLQSAIFTWCQYQPDIVAIRMNSGAIKNKSGFYKFLRLSPPHLRDKGAADIEILCNGKALFVECKTDDEKWKPDKNNKLRLRRTKGKQSPEQLAFQKAVEAVGAKYLLAYEVEEVKAAVNQMRNV